MTITTSEACIETSQASDIPIGAHLTTPRRGFMHHGIYVGNGRVVHYPGSSRLFDTGPIAEVDLVAFEHGRGLQIEETPSLFDPDEVVRRARSRIGEDAYRVRDNNCEHFCTWCRTGYPRSAQVETYTRPLSQVFAWVVGTMPIRWRPAAVAAAPDFS